MPLDASALAGKMWDAMSSKGAAPTSANTKNYAKGLIDTLKAGIVSNLPGTITGVTAAAAPLVAGAGIGGLMVLVPALMIAQSCVGVEPVAAINIAKENTALVTYLMTGLVAFQAGAVTGQCTSTPITPGPLAGGTATNGKITMLTGAGAMAAVIAALGSGGPDMLGLYSAIVNYVVDNATVSYTLVTGTCPAGGGPLAAGAAAGGSIS